MQVAIIIFYRSYSIQVLPVVAYISNDSSFTVFCTKQLLNLSQEPYRLLKFGVRNFRSSPSQKCLNKTLLLHVLLLKLLNKFKLTLTLLLSYTLFFTG